MKIYKVRDVLLPKNSKRRLIVKLILRLFRNPKMIVHYLNPRNFFKFLKGFFMEDAETLQLKTDKYIHEHTYHSTDDLEIFETAESPNEAVIEFEKVLEPKVSIIIPVYNQWNYTYNCLKSIKENTVGIDYEIIIADDNSSDETVNIESYFRNIIHVRNPENKMFLLNCNNAAKHAKGKYILFLNNDTNVQADWLSSMIEVIDKDEMVGLIGSKLIYKDGRLQEAGGIIWDDASGWNFGRLDDVDKADYNYLKEVDYVSGASMMIRSELWSEIGGFDERYVPAYYEDADLAFEVRKRGYKVIFQPKSKVVHFEGISHGTDEDSGIKKHQKENRTKFLEKWKEELSQNHFPNADHVFWASDRTKGKKTIVVVDHYVPHYDKDAGSKCTFAYIKLFMKMGLKVIFIGDNFYPHQPYTDTLQQMGVFVLYGNYYFNHIQKWIKDNGQYFDYVYLNRPHISVKYIDQFKAHSKAKIIYFGHDLHYVREQRNYEIEKDNKLLESSKKWKKVEFNLFDKADVVYAVGSFEQEVISKEFPDKPVRNIPVYIFDEKSSDTPYSFEGRRDIMFVGGFAHKPNIDAVLWFVNEIWPTIKKNIEGIKFHVIGSNPTDEVLALDSEDVLIHGFVSDEELEEYYRTTRLSVVPLRFGAGVKGKVVEAMHIGTPVVTTSIGAEGLAGAEEGIAVYDDADEMASRIIELYADEKELRELVNNAKKFVDELFSLEYTESIVGKDICN